jgi:3-dehydrosphinganine reductase
MKFVGKRVLITGGSSGIGLAAARKFYEAGAEVILVSRNPERLKQAADSLGPAAGGQSVHTYPADVTDAAQIKNVVDAAAAELGPPDILINSAGGAHPGYVQELGLDIFRRMMEVNYFGTVHTNQAVLPHLLAQKSGHIVNIASFGAIITLFGYSAYGASKYAVRGYSEALRAEMKAHGIRVSVVYPPDTQTPQLAHENQFKPPETFAITRISRLRSPEDVAADILNGVQRNKFIILPGFDTKLFYWAIKFLGTWVHPVLDTLAAQGRTRERT